MDAPRSAPSPRANDVGGPARPPRRPLSRPALVAALLVPWVIFAPAPAAAADVGDSLSVGVTRDDRDELWPVQVSLEIAPAGRGAQPLPARTVVVPGGNRLVFDSVIHTPRGQRRFRFEVTPRQHPRRTVELEWRLRVEEARYELGPHLAAWRAYALHRLGLGPRPALGRQFLAASRADIVTTRGEPVEATVRLEGQIYTIRLAARTTARD